MIVNFFLLQKGVSNEEHKFLKKFSNVEVLDNKLEDFSQTALVLSLMDKVITIDTSLVHLAGTLGPENIITTSKSTRLEMGFERFQNPMV